MQFSHVYLTTYLLMRGSEIIFIGEIKKSGKSRSLESNEAKDMKITDPVLLSPFMRDEEKCKISHAPYHRYSILSH